MYNMILSINNNGGLGKDNKLLYHISEDLKRFKVLTTNNIVIMGRKTFESMGNKPLPNRINIVISNTLPYTFNKEKCLIICNKEKLNSLLENIKGEFFIIGGASLYEDYINIVDKVYLTLVKDDNTDFDTKFDFNLYKDNFILTDVKERYDSINNLSFDFKTYKRKLV